MRNFGFVLVIFLISCKSEGGYWYFFNLFEIPIFGFFLSIAFLLGFFYLKKVLAKEALREFFWEKIIILTGVLGILGAKLFHALETNFATEGLTWYGGFILSAVGILLYANLTNISIEKLLDYFVFPLAMGYALGRLGCFFSGDGCYGVACPNSWVEPFCMAFPNGLANWQDVIERYHNPKVKVYNTPLWEATFSFLSYFFLRMVIKPNAQGILFFSFLFAHSVNRFFIEFLRQNPKVLGNLSQAQVISLILAFLSVWWVLKIINLSKYHDLNS